MSSTEYFSDHESESSTNCNHIVGAHSSDEQNSNNEIISKIECPFLVKTSNNEYGVAVINIQRENDESYGVRMNDDNRNKDNYREIEDFDFMGFIFPSKSVKKIEATVDYLPDSKYIDDASVFYTEFDFSETVQPKSFCKFRSSDETDKLKIVKRVKLNLVECLQIEKIGCCNKKYFVKIEDVKVIENMRRELEYYNHTIIKPQSILNIDTGNVNKFRLNEPVQFEDDQDSSFQGKLVWTGKVNDVTACLVILNDYQELEPYTISGTFLNQTLFEGEERAIFVGASAINHDVISYLTCKKTGLQVVDPKYKHTIKNENFTEKLLIFSFNSKKVSMKLKWKGCIYAQMAVGCEMNMKSEEGSEGVYGSQQLFQCSPKKGIIITADKVNSLNIKDLCELSSHKELESAHAPKGFKFYLKKSICCIEKSKEIIQLSQSAVKFEIGCKILYKNEFIGVCKFIGKINGQPSIGIQSNIKLLNENPSLLDVISDYGFDAEIYEFLDIENLSAGSYYVQETSVESSSIHDDRIRVGLEAKYYPQNNQNLSPLCGTIKWHGRYENNNSVYGIELNEKPTSTCTGYFFENLFDCKPDHGVIDDDFKFYPISNSYNQTECESCPNFNNKLQISQERIIKGLLKPIPDIKILDIADDLINFYIDDFKKMLKDKENPFIKIKYLPGILKKMFDNNKINEIKEILANLKEIKIIFLELLDLFSDLISKGYHDCVNCALDELQISDDNDQNNLGCLWLAIKCLENRKPSIEKSGEKELYEKLIEKCINKKMLIKHSGNEEETFLTNIIPNMNISDEIIITVLESNKFDINQENSLNFSPMEVAINARRSNVFKKLLDLGCDDSKLRSILGQLENKDDPLLIPIIKLGYIHLLDKKNVVSPATETAHESQKTKCV